MFFNREQLGQTRIRVHEEILIGIFLIIFFSPINIMEVKVDFEHKLAIPTYFYPCTEDDCYWRRLINNAKYISFAIINPNSGVGEKFNPDYKSQVNQAKLNNLKIIGYVYTKYAKRPLKEVKDEIQLYYQFYEVDGIFFDEVSPYDKDISYYKDIHDFALSEVKSNSPIFVFNPGTNIDESFLRELPNTIFVTFEGNFENYLNWESLGWETRYPKERFWHLIYKTEDSQINEIFRLFKNRHVGNIYITPDNLPNPWDTLPDINYWDKLVGKLRNPD